MIPAPLHTYLRSVIEAKVLASMTPQECARSAYYDRAPITLGGRQALGCAAVRFALDTQTLPRGAMKLVRETVRAVDVHRLPRDTQACAALVKQQGATYALRMDALNTEIVCAMRIVNGRRRVRTLSEVDGWNCLLRAAEHRRWRTNGGVVHYPNAYKYPWTSVHAVAFERAGITTLLLGCGRSTLEVVQVQVQALTTDLRRYRRRLGG